MFDVSIIMPVYNVADHLPRAIESALAQKNGVCEIILVNDGSTDASGEICDEYALKEPLLITVVHQENQGSGPARNAGLQKAKGDYIYFADPDDYFDAYLVADNSRLAKKKQSDTVVFGYIQEKAGDNKNREVHLPNLPQLKTQEAVRNHFRNIYHFSPYALWNKLYRRAFLERNKIAFGEQRQGQDAIFNINVYNNVESMAVNRMSYCNHVYKEDCKTFESVKAIYNEKFMIVQEFEKMYLKWDEDSFREIIIGEAYFELLIRKIDILIHSDNKTSALEKENEIQRFWNEHEDKIIPLKLEFKNPIKLYIIRELSYRRYKKVLLLVNLYSNTTNFRKSISKVF